LQRRHHTPPGFTMPKTRPFSRRLAPLALALAAASVTLPRAHAKDAPEPVAVDAQFKPEALAGSLLSVSDTKALKGIKRVAVPQFAVEFVVADNVSASTSGFGSAGRASSTGYYKLVGVGEPDFQALAEGFHAAFLKQLQDSGLEVVAAAEVAAAPTYRKLVASGTPLPIRGDAAITVAPAGMASYGMNRVQTTAAKPGLFGALSNIASVGENETLQKELGGAALVEVTMRVHFAQLTNNNKGFWGKLSDTASVSGKLSAQISSGQMTVMQGPHVGVVALKQPLVLDPAAFSELRKEAKTAGDVAGAVAVGLLRLAIGSKDSSSSESFEAVADKARYREVVGAGMVSLGEVFNARLKAER
jgi:hypothetical protein